MNDPLGRAGRSTPFRRPRPATRSARAVTTVADLRRAAADVEQALVGRGLALGSPVVVKLRSRSALARSGLLTDPHAWGVCRARWTSPDRTDSIEIALVAGLPGIQARAVLAHEYGHALMFDRLVWDLPPALSEGFSEFIAHTYLRLDDGSREARAIAQGMVASTDPVYGAGLRLIRSRVRSHGFPAVWEVLTRGTAADRDRLLRGEPLRGGRLDAGLPAPSLCPPRRTP